MDNVTITKVENGYIVNRVSVRETGQHASVRVFQTLKAALQSAGSFFELHSESEE